MAIEYTPVVSPRGTRVQALALLAQGGRVVRGARRPRGGWRIALRPPPESHFRSSRQSGTDLSLEIKYIEEGSVRLTIALTAEAAQRLLELRAAGQLKWINGFEVDNVLQLAVEQARAQEDAEQKRRVMRYRRERRIARIVGGGEVVYPDIDRATFERMYVDLSRSSTRGPGV